MVDPSRTTRLIVARMLEAGGHEVEPFADERDALARIKADASIEALITSAELKHNIRSGALLGDAVSRHQPPPDLRA